MYALPTLPIPLCGAEFSGMTYLLTSSDFIFYSSVLGEALTLPDLHYYSDLFTSPFFKIPDEMGERSIRLHICVCISISVSM